MAVLLRQVQRGGGGDSRSAQDTPGAMYDDGEESTFGHGVGDVEQQCSEALLKPRQAMLVGAMLVGCSTSQEPRGVSVADRS